MDVWMDGCVHGWMNAWVGGWIDGLCRMDGWMDGSWINSKEYYAAMKRSEVLTQGTTWMNPEHTTVREADAEGHMVCASIEWKCPEQANPQRQEADSMLPNIVNI